MQVQAEYLNAYFPGYDNNGCRAVGEGSVSYLYSPHAVKTILRFNPDALFIAMVRNPVDLVYSHYQRMVYVMQEDEPDFATAWSLQTLRTRGEQVPPNCREPRLLQYAEVGMLGRQIERLFEQAGRDRCMVIIFDDFTADTAAVYRRVLRFIGVDDDKREHFPPKRANKSFKHPGLQRLLYNPPRQLDFLVRLAERSKRKQKGDRKPFLRQLRRWLLKKNEVEKRAHALDDSTRQRMNEVFADDIRLLGSLLDRDLSHWS